MGIDDIASSFGTDTGDVGVLFLHGFTGSPASLRPWAERTAEAGYRVSLPLLPGHGTIWQELAVTSWQDWYDCADREYRRLRESCDQVFVAGLSMGGALALRIAQHHPDVAGLMLVNPAVLHAEPRQYLVPLLRHLVPAVKGIGNDINKPGQDEHSYDTAPVNAVHEMHRLWADVRSTLDLVTCPLVLFRSLTDHVVPAASSAVVLRQVSSADLTEHALPRSFHVATLDHDADTIVAESLAFLSRVSGQPPRMRP